MWHLTQPIKKITNLVIKLAETSFQAEHMEFSKWWDWSHSGSSVINDYNCSMHRHEQDWKAPWLEPQPLINPNKDNPLYSWQRQTYRLTLIKVKVDYPNFNICVLNECLDLGWLVWV